MVVSKKLTYAEHQDLAARVKAAGELLIDIQVRISNGLGSESQAAKMASAIAEHFTENLKNELDNILFRDCGDRPDKDLKGLYYGSPSRNKVELLTPRE